MQYVWDYFMDKQLYMRALAPEATVNHIFPADTWRNNNVIVTSIHMAPSFSRNNDIIITLCVHWVYETQLLTLALHLPLFTVNSTGEYENTWTSLAIFHCVNQTVSITQCSNIYFVNITDSHNITIDEKNFVINYRG